jgi:hypothetical protein
MSVADEQERNPMTHEQSKRVIQAMDETQRMLAKLETAYDRRPDHLRTDEDRKLIDFHHRHVAKLAAMLA